MSRYDFTPWLVALGFMYLAWVFRRELAAGVLAAVDFLVYGKGEVTGDGPDTEAGVETPFPPASDGGAGTSNGPSRLGSGGSPSSVDFREALKPIGPAPSWAEVRRGE